MKTVVILDMILLSMQETVFEVDCYMLPAVLADDNIQEIYTELIEEGIKVVLRAASVT